MEAVGQLAEGLGTAGSTLEAKRAVGRGEKGKRAQKAVLCRGLRASSDTRWAEAGPGHRMECEQMLGEDGHGEGEESQARLPGEAGCP